MSSQPPNSDPTPTETPAPGPSIDGVPVGQFALRMIWVAARIVMVAYLGSSGATFFYQGF